jgi:hypothetical protein
MEPTPNGAPADALDIASLQEFNPQDASPALIDPADVEQSALLDPAEFEQTPTPPRAPATRPRKARVEPATGETLMPELAQVSRPREPRPPREPREKPPAPNSPAMRQPSYEYEHKNKRRIRRSLRRGTRPSRSSGAHRKPWVRHAARVLMFVMLFGLSLLVGIAIAGGQR